MTKQRTQYMKEYRSKKKAEETESTKLLAEIERGYKANRKLIVEAMKTLSPGTKVYLDHCNALDKLDRNHRAELVERGLSPENLGAATAPGWKFVCVTAARGETTIVEVRPGQPDPKSAPWPTRTEEELRGIEELEKEFS
jgi:hypothetical protein